VNVVNMPPVFTTSIAYNATADPPAPGPVSFLVTAAAADQDSNTAITNYKFEAIENGQVKDVQILGTGEAYFNLSQYSGAHTFSFRVTATDNENGSTLNIGTTTYTFTNTIIVNEPPVITSSLQASRTGIIEGENVIFSITATDPENDTLAYEWTVTASNGQFVTENTTVGTYTHTFATAGNYSVRVTISDGINEVQSGPVTIQVTTTIPNQPPIITGQLTSDPASPVVVNTEVTFSVVASDPDNDSLTYEWIINNNSVFTGAAASYVHTFTEVDVYFVQVKVSDGSETILSDIILINVTP